MFLVHQVVAPADDDAADAAAAPAPAEPMEHWGGIQNWRTSCLWQQQQQQNSDVPPA